MDPIVDAALITVFGPKANDLIERAFGQGADIIGAYLKSRLECFATNLKPIAEKATRILSDAEIQPQAVPSRILLPLLESAAIEDEDSMQDLWAHLLATAATDLNSIHPGFAEVLKQLTPGEARKLTHLYDVAMQPSNTVHFDETLSGYPEWKPALESFQRHWLLTMDTTSFVPSLNPPLDYPSFVYESLPLQRYTEHAGPILRVYTFTQFGISFMQACTGKEPGTTPGKPYTVKLAEDQHPST